MDHERIPHMLYSFSKDNLTNDERSSRVVRGHSKTDSKKCSKSAPISKNFKKDKSSTFHTQSGDQKQNQPNFSSRKDTPLRKKGNYSNENSPSQSTPIKDANSLLGVAPVISLSGSVPFLEDVHKKVKKDGFSLIDLKSSGTGDLPSHPSDETKLPLASSRCLHFRNGFPPYHQKEFCDQGFDLMGGGGLFGGLWSTPRFQKGTLSLVPTSTETPVFKKRTYSLEIHTDGDKTEDRKEKKFEKAESDASFSSTETGSSEDSVFVADASAPPSRENAVGNCNTAPLLDLKKPIRLGYVDEATGHDGELLIYTDEFLEVVSREKGKVLSKKDILESVLEYCRNYEGKRIRVIFYSEKLLNVSNTPLSPVGKTYRKNSPTPDVTTRPRRNACSAPCRMNSFSSDSRSNSENKWRNNFRKFHEEKNSDLYAVLSTESLSKKGFEQLRSEGRSEVKFGSRQPTCVRAKAVAKSFNALGDGKMSRSVNVEKIIASDFRNVFHAYAKYGGRLKSGAAISKLNSHLWCRRAGVIFDQSTQTIADECFSAIARSKLVLNISDYLQYLTAVARRRRLLLTDLVTLLNNVDIPRSPQRSNELSKWSCCSEQTLAMELDEPRRRRP